MSDSDTGYGLVVPAKKILEETLLEVRRSIRETPDSVDARKDIERKLQDVFNNRVFQIYTGNDFVQLIELGVLGMGYAKKGISNILLLEQLAKVVPSRLGLEVIFPIRENGTRRFMYITDAVNYMRAGRWVALNNFERTMVASFGTYALFLSGFMPDLLASSVRKGGVGVDYYERFGANALAIAVRSGGLGPELENTVDEIASGFRRHRIFLNEVGAMIGTAARKTLFENILESYGIKEPLQAIRGPLKVKRIRPEVDGSLLVDYPKGGLMLEHGRDANSGPYISAN